MPKNASSFAPAFQYSSVHHCFLGEIGSRVFFLHHEGVIITVTSLMLSFSAFWGLEMVWLNPCSCLTLRPKEGPVTGGDGLVVLPDGHGDGAGEDVEGELLYPLVPVALVELGAV